MTGFKFLRPFNFGGHQNYFRILLNSLARFNLKTNFEKITMHA